MAVRGTRSSAADSLYRAVWRWHFYAGLIVLPVLVWLAATGALYLYKPELERTLFPGLVELPERVSPAPLADLIASVERQTQARVTQVSRPASPDESWRFATRADDGTERLAFVRPDSGDVLGTSAPGGPIEVIKDLHSLALAGPAANVLVEIVAGWAIVLVASGFYLWWPRGGHKALSLAGRVGERRFWRNFHSSVGALVGAVIMFLAVTGMPWTTFWGGRFHALVAERQIGRPPAPHGTSGIHDEHLPWSLRGAAHPHAMGGGDVGPDAAVRAAIAQGLAAPWVLDLPGGPGQPYRIAPLIERAQDARVIYVEPATGRILQDDRWAGFGVGAKAFEWGIATHQGHEYGEPNRLVMLAGCLGVWLLAGSAPVLWWKRRRGRLSPPPRAVDRTAARGVAAIMVALGVLFPLTGLTMAAALLGDLGWARWTGRRPAS